MGNVVTLVEGNLIGGPILPPPDTSFPWWIDLVVCCVSLILFALLQNPAGCVWCTGPAPGPLVSDQVTKSGVSLDHKHLCKAWRSYLLPNKESNIHKCNAKPLVADRSLLKLCWRRCLCNRRSVAGGPVFLIPSAFYRRLRIFLNITVPTKFGWDDKANWSTLNSFKQTLVKLFQIKSDTEAWGIIKLSVFLAQTSVALYSTSSVMPMLLNIVVLGTLQHWRDIPLFFMDGNIITSCDKSLARGVLSSRSCQNIWVYFSSFIWSTEGNWHSQLFLM